jgi:hyaluronan synthase
VTNLTGKQLFFPVLALLQWVTLPLMWVWVAISVVLWGGAGHVLLAFSVYMLIHYGEVALYIVTRPGMGFWPKLWTWLLLTPLCTLVNLGVTRPAKYHALFKLKVRGWETRGNAHADDAREAQPSAPPARYRHAHEPPSTALAASMAARDRTQIRHRRDGDNSSTRHISADRLAQLLAVPADQ